MLSVVLDLARSHRLFSFVYSDFVVLYMAIMNIFWYLLCQIWQDPADFVVVLYCRSLLTFWFSVVLDLARSHRSICYVMIIILQFMVSVVLDLARSHRLFFYHELLMLFSFECSDFVVLYMAIMNIFWYLLCQIWQDPTDLVVVSYYISLLSFCLSVVLDLARSHRPICYVWCARPNKVPQTYFLYLYCILQLLYVFGCFLLQGYLMFSWSLRTL